MRCPKFSGKMWPAEVRGHPVDQCTACAGVLVEREAVGRLVRSEKASFDVASLFASPDSKKETEHVCPICRCTLDAITLQRVVIEVCPECTAVFFDAGEVATVRKHLRSRRLVRSISDADPQGILELVFVLIGEVYEYYRTRNA